MVIIKDLKETMDSIFQYIKKKYAAIKQNEFDINPFIKWVPPGHFFSPIPSLEEIKLKENEIFGTVPREIPGVELNMDEQLELFNNLKTYYQKLPFDIKKKMA